MTDLPRFVADTRTGDGPFPRYGFCFATYNAAGTIGPLLDSLERQRESGLEFEVTACDDASTDEQTPALLLAARPWLVLVRNETNSGPSVARNRAAAASTAEILIFLDADVVLAPDTLQQIDAFLAEHPDCGAFHWPMSAELLAPGPVGLYKTLLDRHMTRLQRPGTHPTKPLTTRFRIPPASGAPALGWASIRSAACSTAVRKRSPRPSSRHS